MQARRIAHYDIVEKLGEGGMGVVWKARDHRLNRLVAIKLLRLGSASSSDRVTRFIQEARAASALNHPNIITIYDVGQDEGGHYIAMEFVEGRTLDSLARNGRLKFADALKYAAQIADALAAAHRAGIVHRDLKPSNIMVTDSGLVKVLDFGLAKLTEAEPADPDSPTRTSQPETEDGAIIGTLAYMSPEQAEGRKVDARSDIFSFGSVLYEMVTGRRAFNGATNVSTLFDILHNDPKPAGELAPDTPPELEKIIARCLRKDRERRTRHMDDVKLALEEIREESESGKLSSTTRLPASGPLPSPYRVIAIIAVAVFLIASAGLAWWLTRPPPAVSNSDPVLTRLTNDGGLTTNPALSPDGKLVAYASDRATDGNLDVWVQQVGGGGAVRLTDSPADDLQPAFSPDGTRVAFRSERDGGGIYVIPALGNAEPRLIAERGQHPQFSPDGNWIVYVVGSTIAYGVNMAIPHHLFVASSTGGSPKRIEPGFASAAYPIWLPDGKHVLFLGRKDASSPVDATLDWWVASLDGSPAVKTGAFDVLRKAGIVTTDITARPSPSACFDGQVIFAGRRGDSTNLWQISLTGEPWTIEGPPRRLTFGTATERDASVAGTEGARFLVFSSSVPNLHVWTFGIDADRAAVTSPIQAVTRGPARNSRPSISRDGNRVVYVSNRSGSSEVWRHDFSTGKDEAVTAMPGRKDSPIISPDGGQVAYTVEENGKADAFIATIAGGGVPRKVCEGILWLLDWTAEGLLYGKGSPRTVAVINPITGASRDLLKYRDFGADRASVSADSSWVAFRTQSGTDDARIFVAPIRPSAPTPEAEWIPIYEGGRNDRPAAAWSPDGKLVYLLLDRDGFRCLWAQRLDSATKRPLGSPFAVQHWHGLRRGVPSTGWGRSIGGGRFVFAQTDLTGNLWMTRLQ